jgi:maltose-binding protein MalE
LVSVDYKSYKNPTYSLPQLAEDIVFLVRKDQRKYARVKDLLTMNEELKKARKAFDEVKYVST